MKNHLLSTIYSVLSEKIIKKIINPKTMNQTNDNQSIKATKKLNNYILNH